jgi:hypothetical protein
MRMRQAALEQYVKEDSADKRNGDENEEAPRPTPPSGLR